ncbi:GLPGLI family protein [Parasediminibacterium paludis]|uniref:GLPGLI family protein n=1 Tax=Parasediminibacterium paludis TaxID=908966 RepID=A0ABV8PRN6_9BACT
MKILLASLLTILTLTSFAQTQFITAGRVEYEKTYNQHSVLDDEHDEGDWIQQMRKEYPKFVRDVYELQFANNKSSFKLAKENPDNKYLWRGKPSTADVTVKDCETNRIALQKEVFETQYLLQDSMRNYQWRITDETRTIAGFECKKAVTKICDSVYVVAFYTDQIMISSGPESFGGLPGLILGLAVPRLHTTWFATKLELIQPTAIQTTPPQKGKKTTWQQLEADLTKLKARWGDYGTKYLWNFML